MKKYKKPLALLIVLIAVVLTLCSCGVSITDDETVTANLKKYNYTVDIYYNNNESDPNTVVGWKWSTYVYGGISVTDDVVYVIIATNKQTPASTVSGTSMYLSYLYIVHFKDVESAKQSYELLKQKNASNNLVETLGISENVVYSGHKYAYKAAVGNSLLSLFNFD